MKMKLLNVLLVLLSMFAGQTAFAGNMLLFSDIIEKGKLLESIATVKTSDGVSYYDDKRDEVALAVFVEVVCPKVNAPYPSICLRKGDLYLAILKANGWDGDKAVIGGKELVKQAKEKGILIPVPDALLVTTKVVAQASTPAPAPTPTPTPTPVASTPIGVDKDSLDSLMKQLSCGKGGQLEGSPVCNEVAGIAQKANTASTKVEALGSRVDVLSGNVARIVSVVEDTATGLKATNVQATQARTTADEATATANSALKKSSDVEAGLKAQIGVVTSLQGEVGKNDPWIWTSLVTAILAVMGVVFVFARKGVTEKQAEAIVLATVERTSELARETSERVTAVAKGQKEMSDIISADRLANAGKLREFKDSLENTSKKLEVVKTELDQVSHHIDLENYVRFDDAFTALLERLKTSTEEEKWSCRFGPSREESDDDEICELFFKRADSSSGEKVMVDILGIKGQTEPANLFSKKRGGIKGLIGRAAQPDQKTGEPHRFTKVMKVQPLNKVDKIDPKPEADVTDIEDIKPKANGFVAKQPILKAVKKTAKSEKDFPDTIVSRFMAVSAAS